jgi:UDP-N-acetylmuramoylalanine--D-glutamate ligase
MAQARQKPRSLVVGLGKTGLSCARYLAAQGLPLAVTDTRLRPPALRELREILPDVAVFVGGFDAGAFAAAEQLVVSPGISLEEPLIRAARDRGAAVLGDVELFARAARAPIVAITGTNGKSTVTALLGEMARQAGRRVAVGGNIGTPVLDLLVEQGPQPDLYVIELSSFQLETTTSLNAAAAVVLNLTPDHLDRHGDLERYRAAKARVYAGARVKVVNLDDPLVASMVPPQEARGFTAGPPSWGQFGLVPHGHDSRLAYGDERLALASELLLVGRHNLVNALAAMALGRAMGLPVSPMIEALRRFPGLPHRCQWVASSQGVQWYNDSKGTNVGATLAALQGMDGSVVLIAGGDGKGQDFSPLCAAVREKARGIVLIGRDAPLIEAALGSVPPVAHARDMREAVRAARRMARPGDSVLLSPACASFDMYRNYEHRGEVFMRAVQALLPAAASGLRR